MYDQVGTINNTHWPAYRKPGSTLAQFSNSPWTGQGLLLRSHAGLAHFYQSSKWVASGPAAIGVNLSFIAKGLHRVEPRGAPSREQTRHARHGEQENRNGGKDAGIQGWHAV
jgi:hypothetical protein